MTWYDMILYDIIWYLVPGTSHVIYTVPYLVVQLAVVVVIKSLEGVLQSPLIQWLPAGASNRPDRKRHMRKKQTKQRIEQGVGGRGRGQGARAKQWSISLRSKSFTESRDTIQEKKEKKARGSAVRRLPSRPIVLLPLPTVGYKSATSYYLVLLSIVG